METGNNCTSLTGDVRIMRIAEHIYESHHMWRSEDETDYSGFILPVRLKSMRTADI